MPVTNIESKWAGGNLSFVATKADASVKIGDGTTMTDYYLYGADANSYLQWDGSASKFLSAGAMTLQVGESTTGVTTAGGTTMIYGYAVHKTNALTGNLRGVRGNAQVLVASANGTVEGVLGRAANGSSTVATDGVNAGTLIGVSALVAGVGQTGPATITNAYGVYSQLDINAADLTVTNARGIYVNVQAQASGSTITNCDLAYLEYESVAGTAAQINSGIKMVTTGGTGGLGCLIDASGAALNVMSGNVVVLFKFKDKAGTVNYVIHDTDSANALSVTTSAPSS